MQLPSSINAILFDLDGTLLDTAQDLITALKAFAIANHIPIIKKNSIYLRAAAGQGCRGLLKTGLNIDDTDPKYTQYTTELLQHYENHLLETTQLFPGMPDVLAHLESNNIPWGIVTNKPKKYTDIILSGLDITKRAQCVISGDSLTNRKPHPEPLLYASTLLGKSPEQCLYIGDSEIDVIASRAAGMHSLAALYGYIAETDQPQNWNAYGYIQHPIDILKWLNTQNRPQI